MDGEQPLRPHRRAFLAGTGAAIGMGVLPGVAQGRPPTSAPGRSSARTVAEPTPQWRPRVRFSAERNWLNDPNGLVFFDGEYHLFFQYNAAGRDHAKMSWGHAVSTDLVRWEQRAVALEPDALGEIYSGGAVVDQADTSGFFGGEPGLVAFYTSAGETQQQSIAYSADGGATWRKYADNPIIANPGVEDFRDPKVFWHEPSRKWVLMLAADDRIMFYGSTDLVNWVKLSEFGVGQGAHGGVWECPDLFELPVDGDPRDTRWVLIVSINPGGPAGGSATQYFVGSFDGGTFTNHAAPNVVRWVDRGADFYAAQSWSNAPDGRRLWVAWLSNWDYAEDVPTAPWRGSMSVPREVRLGEHAGMINLTQRPVTELASARRNRREWRGLVTGTQPLPDVSGGSLDVLAAFDVSTAAAVHGEFGLDVFVDPEHRTRVGYDARAGELFIDRSQSQSTAVHRDFPVRHGTPLSVPDGVLRMRVVIDQSSVEVFAADGHVALSDLVLPDDPENSGVSVFSTATPADAEVEVFDLVAS